MRNLLTFLWKHYFIILFLILETFSIILVTQHSYYQRSIIINATNQFTGSVNRSFHAMVDYFSLRKINQQLAEENAILHSILSDTLTEERIRDIVVKDTTLGQVYHYIDAKVVSNTVNKSNNFIMLNRGIRHGVRKDMAVIAPSGIVGIIKEVSRNYSTVLPVLHNQSRISAKLKGTNHMGTVMWEGIDYRRGILSEVPTHAVVNAGDSVITSGYSLIFPEGIMIGTVRDISLDEGDNFFTIRIDFSVDYNSLGLVYIVRNFHKEELDWLEQTIRLDETP